MAQQTDALGNVTEYQLDGQGRLLEQIAANGGVTLQGWNNGYLTSTTDPDGRTTTYALDSDGYTTQVTNPDGTTESYQYQSDFHALTQSTDQNGKTTTYAYDGSGHLTSTTDPNHNVTAYAYNSLGEQTSMTDPRGAVTTFAYDTLRRLTTTTAPNGGITHAGLRCQRLRADDHRSARPRHDDAQRRDGPHHRHHRPLRRAHHRQLQRCRAGTDLHRSARP